MTRNIHASFTSWIGIGPSLRYLHISPFRSISAKNFISFNPLFLHIWKPLWALVRDRRDKPEDRKFWAYLNLDGFVRRYWLCRGGWGLRAIWKVRCREDHMLILARILYLRGSFSRENNAFARIIFLREPSFRGDHILLRIMYSQGLFSHKDHVVGRVIFLWE